MKIVIKSPMFLILKKIIFYYHLVIIKILTNPIENNLQMIIIITHKFLIPQMIIQA